MALNYDDKKDIIKKDKLKEFFELMPEDATIHGCHDYDDRTSGATEDDIKYHRKFVSDWVNELKRQYTPSQLSSAERLDLEVLAGFNSLSDFLFEELKGWQRNPSATDDYSSILFLMLTYKTDDEEKRYKDIASRLEKMPQFVHEYNSRIKNVPYRWRDIALEANQSIPVLLDAILKGASEKVGKAVQDRVEKGVKVAKECIKNQEDWLKNLKVEDGETWVIGPEKFEELLKRKRIPLDSKEILEIGKEYLAKSKEERKNIAAKISPSGNLKAAAEKIEADHPDNFKSALQEIKKISLEARSFIEKKRIIEIPEDEELEIVETPDFLHPTIPFAAIFTAAKFDPHQKAVYVVTPPASPAAFKKHFNRASIYNTAIHEGYPGHHLQKVIANKNCTIVRSGIFGSAIDLVEGWAHYCEEMVKEHGFHDTPEGRFIMLNDQVWRACRVIIDVKLSRGEMTYDDAARMLVEEVDMSRESARREVNRYIQSPGYILCYLIGKHLLKDLRSALKKKKGLGFDEAKFHNELLSFGNIPISYIMREMLETS